MQAREIETTVSPKGQVTIPKKIRAQLGLNPKDNVPFELEGKVVCLRPAPSRIARHFEAVQLAGKALDAKAEREAFERLPPMLLPKTREAIDHDATLARHQRPLAVLYRERSGQA